MIRKILIGLVAGSVAIFCVSILSGCGGGDKDLKMRQIAVWEDQGWSANGKLIELLFDDEDDVRERAALALARINDTLTIDSVTMAYFDDSDPEVRAMAAFAFGAGLWKMGREQVAESFARDDNPIVIRATLQAMSRLYMRDGYESIFPLLHHEDPKIREQAVLTLNNLNRRDEVDSLIPLLHDPDRSVQWATLFTLITTKDSAVSLAALPFLQDTSVEMRRLAYRVVGSSPDLSLKDSLLKGLSDPNVLVRASAAEAFSLQVDTVSIEKTYPYLESETNPLVLMNLLKSLEQHWRAAAEPYLRKLITHDDPGVRAAAVKTAVRRLDMDFADVVAPAAKDPSPLVRIAYCEAIDGIRNYVPYDPALVIDRVDSLTFDPVPRVRARALQSYMGLGGPNSIAYLNRIYNDSDFYCQQMAVNLIGMYRMQTYTDSLYEKYKAHIDMWRPELKWAILASVTNSAPSVSADPVRREILNWGMSDPNRLVRWYTIAVWEKFRENRRDELGVYKTDLTTENVDKLLYPYPSNPKALLETTRGRITLELLQDRAPRAVRRFIAIAQGGYYDDCPMNDVQPGNLVQTGDLGVNGWGLPDETVRDELQPDRVGTGDVLWLINSRDSGHGAFVILLSRSPYLDWRYSQFAKVVGGLEVAQSLTFADSIKTVTIEAPGAM